MGEGSGHRPGAALGRGARAAGVRELLAAGGSRAPWESGARLTPARKLSAPRRAGRQQRESKATHQTMDKLGRPSPMVLKRREQQTLKTTCSKTNMFFYPFFFFFNILRKIH